MACNIQTGLFNLYHKSCFHHWNIKTKTFWPFSHTTTVLKQQNLILIVCPKIVDYKIPTLMEENFHFFFMVSHIYVILIMHYILVAKQPQTPASHLGYPPFSSRLLKFSLIANLIKYCHLYCTPSRHSMPLVESQLYFNWVRYIQCSDLQ